MNLLKLIRKEIIHRKVNFTLSIIAVAVAAASWLLSEAFLKSANLKSEALIQEKVDETEAHMKKLEDDIRKSMKGLGFNIYIFPEGQDLSEVYSEGYASKTMPEEYVYKLANSNIVTVNHLLPTLTQSLEWPEHKRKVVLIGIRGQVPKSHGNPKKPLVNPVAENDMVLGYELHTSLGLKPGDKVKFMGREFNVSKTHRQRGTKDDITVWINLGVCQQLLNKEKRINSILALECNCATVDRIGEIRKELLAILPGTQIIEQDSKALARAEARNKTKETAMLEIDSIKKQQNELRKKRENMVAIMVPFVALLCMASIALLAFLNVKERIYELGLLLSLGVKTSKILFAYLIKAFLSAIIGAGIGLGLFYLSLHFGKESFFNSHSACELIQGSKIILILLAMPILAMLATWLPALWAAQTDPAEVLRHD
ncbi:FtsX-like permease family protein [Lentisphaera marina]|uniref:ABC transporter permease n=1 Tax=Lentisphaera marina TaxID=1111041 RepID=UPI0023671080|nr:FtsX-like permease family protein [Lentisphaera marina]MDD7987316.1 FtsX-like permease family protein [Lentisphaera marina]